MPKLVQIDTCLGTGSTGNIAESIGALAMKKGWMCYMAHGNRYAEKTVMESIEISSRLEEYMHFVRSWLFDDHGLGSSKATRNLIDELDIIKPDIVQIHNLHGYYVNYPILINYLKRNKIPTVITLHDFWTITGHCAYINIECRKWESGCGQCPRLKQYPSALIDQSGRNWKLKAELFGDMDNLTIVPVSYWLNAFIQKSLLRGLKSIVIHNGIDVDKFYPYDGDTLLPNVSWTDFTIMTIATRWTKANGYDDVLKLASILPSYAKILMVGLDDSQIGGLPCNIIGVKKTNSIDQLREMYTKADVVLNLNPEVTFGLVTVEAMACGTPVVVIRNTAGEEIVDENSGYVIDRVEDVIPLIKEIKLRKSSFISSYCRNKVLDYFNSITQYSKYISLYESLLK